MTAKRLKELERIHILRTIINFGGDAGMYGASIADKANEECDHPALEGLPPLTRRGMGAKLSGMWGAGLVKPAYYFEDPALWKATDAGRVLAASIDREEGASHGD